MLMKEPYFQAFRARSEIKITQRCQIKKMDLIDMGYIEHTKKRAQRDSGASFFHGLTHRAMGGRFADFHKAGRQGPHAQPGLNGSTTKQDLLAPDRDRA